MGRLKIISTMLFALWLACDVAVAQDRGIPVDIARAERRVALVIGNADYVTAPLRNPVNDARAMSDTLKGLGFEVILVVNARYRSMRRAIIDFGQRIKSGGVGLFYYAGHGVQLHGKNYLVPTDAKVTVEEEVEAEAVNVSSVLQRMASAGNRLNLVILDACRNNPFARSYRSSTQGLAFVDAPSGSLIAYATAPGKVAADAGARANSIYTAALLREIVRPGIEVSQFFRRVRTIVRKATKGKQVPWESTSLEGSFYFVPPGGKMSGPLATKPPVGSGFSLDDLRRQEKHKALWSRWQARMNRAYKEISAFKGSRNSMRDAWQRFLSAFSENNPYSTEDDTMRREAHRRKLSYALSTPKRENLRPNIRASRRPDLSGLSSQERSSLETACVYAYSQGPSAYNRCLRLKLNELLGG